VIITDGQSSAIEVLNNNNNNDNNDADDNKNSDNISTVLIIVQKGVGQNTFVLICIKKYCAFSLLSLSLFPFPFPPFPPMLLFYYYASRSINFFLTEEKNEDRITHSLRNRIKKSNK